MRLHHITIIASSTWYTQQNNPNPRTTECTSTCYRSCSLIFESMKCFCTAVAGCLSKIAKLKQFPQKNTVRVYVHCRETRVSSTAFSRDGFAICWSPRSTQHECCRVSHIALETSIMIRSLVASAGSSENLVENIVRPKRRKMEKRRKKFRRACEHVPSISYAL